MVLLQDRQPVVNACFLCTAFKPAPGIAVTWLVCHPYRFQSRSCRRGLAAAAMSGDLPLVPDLESMMMSSFSMSLFFSSG